MANDLAAGARSAQRTVFISYSVKDGALAERLQTALRAAGATVDDPATTVQPGDNVQAAISRAIERADIVVVLVTPHSARSRWVSTEAAIAVGRVLSGNGGRVVPIIVGRADLPLLLKEFNAIHIEDDTQIDGAARAVAMVPLDSLSFNDELRRSVALQRVSLDYERSLYAVQRQLATSRVDRLAGTLALWLSAGVAVVTAVGLRLAESVLAEVALGILTAILASTVGFYFGGRSKNRVRPDSEPREP